MKPNTDDDKTAPLALFIALRIESATTGDYEDQYSSLLDQLDDGGDPATIQTQFNALRVAEDTAVHDRLKRSVLRLDAVRETALVTFDDKSLSEMDGMLNRCHELLDQRLLTFGGGHD